MLKFCRRIFIVLLLVQCMPGNIYGQELDYSNVFGEDWKRAEEFERENRYWMETMLLEYQIPYETAIAVVFPELVRYSALRNKMETTLLKALYINLGEEYANFSIGRFQIKPSFAERIRIEAGEIKGKKSQISFMQVEDFDDISNYRKSIVNDLEDPRTQFRYVIAFISICEKKFKTGRLNEEERIRFLSTAYNYGIDSEAYEIRDMMDGRYFTTSLLKSEKYCYADVSLFWYRKNRFRNLAQN